MEVLRFVKEPLKNWRESFLFLFRLMHFRAKNRAQGLLLISAIIGVQAHVYTFNMPQIYSLACTVWIRVV